jgi:hypothetical protein
MKFKFGDRVFVPEKQKLYYFVRFNRLNSLLCFICVSNPKKCLEFLDNPQIIRSVNDSAIPIGMHCNQIKLANDLDSKCRKNV